MGLFKKLKRLKLKDLAKPIKTVASLVPGVGTIVAGAIGVAEKIGSKAGQIKSVADAIKHGGEVAQGDLSHTTGPPFLAGVDFGSLFTKPGFIISAAALFLMFVTGTKKSSSTPRRSPSRKRVKKAGKRSPAAPTAKKRKKAATKRKPTRRKKRR